MGKKYFYNENRQQRCYDVFLMHGEWSEEKTFVRSYVTQQEAIKFCIAKNRSLTIKN